MRDTLIALAAIAVLIGSTIYFYGDGAKHPSAWAPAIGMPQKVARVFKPSSKKSTSKGVRSNEVAIAKQDSEGSYRGQDEGDAEHSFETPNLPSLYSSPQPKKPGAGTQVAAGSAGASVGKSRSAKLIPSQPAPKFVAGVNLQAYASHQGNSLPLPEVSAGNKENLKVYLQCMELKKDGPQYLGTQGCQNMLAKRGASQTAAKAFGPAEVY